MIYSALNLAVMTRLKADTGTGGLYSASGGTAWNTSIISGAYAVRGLPETLAFPYLVYTIDTQPDYTADADAFSVGITFTVFEDARRGLDRVTATLDRLHGDAVLQSGWTPTYGFNRHKLVIATNGYSATGGDCLSQGVTPAAFDQDVNAFSVAMRVSSYFSALRAGA